MKSIRGIQSIIIPYYIGNVMEMLLETVSIVVLTLYYLKWELLSRWESVFKHFSGEKCDIFSFPYLPTFYAT